MKLKFLWQVFNKCTNVKFNENPSSGSRVVFADIQMDRHDKANSCFLQFAYVPKYAVCVCMCARVYMCASTHEVLYLKGVWVDEVTGGN